MGLQRQSYRRVLSGSKRESTETPSASPKANAKASVGSYLLFSMALMVWRVAPVISAI
jgi:hypothetical protein